MVFSHTDTTLPTIQTPLLRPSCLVRGLGHWIQSFVGSGFLVLRVQVAAESLSFVDEQEIGFACRRTECSHTVAFTAMSTEVVSSQDRGP